MHETVLTLMRCPTCHRELRVSSLEERYPSSEMVEGLVTCPAGHTWPVEDGILVFTRDDAPSDPWSNSHADYETYCEHQSAWLASSGGKVIPLLERLHVGPAQVMLDVCTGAGGLLFNLLNQIGRQVDVISLDMSLTIQRHNRRYLLEQHCDRKVSFVAADAADMPFHDGALHHVVSYGMGNMLNKMAHGVSEVARVLTSEGTFTFTHMYVDEGSEGWRVMSSLLRRAGVKEDVRYLGMAPSFAAPMACTGFRSYDIRVTNGVMGEPERDVEAGPLFPYPGERLTEIVVKAVK